MSQPVKAKILPFGSKKKPRRLSSKFETSRKSENWIFSIIFPKRAVVIKTQQNRMKKVPFPCQSKLIFPITLILLSVAIGCDQEAVVEPLIGLGEDNIEFSS